MLVDIAALLTGTAYTFRQAATARTTADAASQQCCSLNRANAVTTCFTLQQSEAPRRHKQPERDDPAGASCVVTNCCDARDEIADTKNR